MPLSTAIRGVGRSRLLLTSVLTAALAVLTAPSAPTAEARLPVERAHQRAHVHKVKVDPRLFGVHDYFQNSLRRSGTGSIRLWDSGTQWKDIFPTEGDPSWDRLDSYVTKAHQDGTEVTLVLGLTPAYAAANPDDPAYPKSMPDLAKYTDYVRAVMTRYDKSHWGYRGIAAYQVWNEANISTFWTGTYDDLGQLVKAVHDVRDEVDPGAKIVAPAMVTRLGYEQKGIKKFYKTVVDGKPIWKYVDAISLNLYPLDVYTDPDHPGTPEDAMALLKTVRGILAQDQGAVVQADLGHRDQLRAPLRRQRREAGGPDLEQPSGRLRDPHLSPQRRPRRQARRLVRLRHGPAR